MSEIKTPVRVQDDFHITLLHSSTDSEIRTAAQRLIYADAQGVPLPEPMKVPMDTISALACLHGALGEMLERMQGAAMAAHAAQQEAQTPSLLVVPGGRA